LPSVRSQQPGMAGAEKDGVEGSSDIYTGRRKLRAGSVAARRAPRTVGNGPHVRHAVGAARYEPERARRVLRHEQCSYRLAGVRAAGGGAKGEVKVGRAHAHRRAAVACARAGGAVGERGGRAWSARHAGAGRARPAPSRAHLRWPPCAAPAPSRS